MSKNELTRVEPEVLEEEIKPRLAMTPREAAIKDAGHAHKMAKKSALEAVAWALKAGAQVVYLKESCAHGEWGGVLKALPFGNSTACKYAALTRSALARFPELAEPLQKRCAVEELTPFIKLFAQGATLTQLYIEWEIIKKPRPIGGNPDLLAWFHAVPEMGEKYPQATKPEELEAKDRRKFKSWLKKRKEETADEELSPEEAARIVARQSWSIARETMAPVMAGVYVDLPPQDLVELETTLDAWHKSVKDALEKQKKELEPCAE